jgi:DNA-binding response OmpR family regulator
VTTVVLIDDDPEFGKALAEALESEGIEVYYAATADKGIELALIHAPEAVIVDEHLPDRRGSTAVRDMRALGFAGLALLVSGNPEVAELADTSGADGWVIKPIDLAALIEAVRHDGEQT